jgi:hypothetical protein
LVLLTLATAQLSCGNAGSDLGFDPGRARPLTALVYFDRDGSGTNTAGDTTVAGILVRLVRVGVPVPLQEGTTAADGSVIFASLDPGTYAAVVDDGFLQDSIVATRTPYTIIVTAGGEQDTMEVGLAPPFVTIQEFRSGVVGQVRIVGGIITAGKHQYTDQAAYLSDSTGALRLQNVRNLDGSNVNDPGDVVRVRGQLSVFNGTPVLNDAVVYLQDFGPERLPDTLLTGEAANAQAALKDAALVRVVNATILDSTTIGGVFRVGVNDGSGRVELLLDPLGFPDRTDFVIGAQIDATGILKPVATGGWQLWPRSGGDYTVH